MLLEAFTIPHILTTNKAMEQMLWNSSIFSLLIFILLRIIFRSRFLFHFLILTLIFINLILFFLPIPLLFVIFLGGEVDRLVWFLLFLFFLINLLGLNFLVVSIVLTLVSIVAVTTLITPSTTTIILYIWTNHMRLYISK